MEIHEYICILIAIIIMTSGAWATTLDSWEDNDYTNNPTWSVVSGTIATSSAQAKVGTYSLSVKGEVNTVLNTSALQQYYVWAYFTQSGSSGDHMDFVLQKPNGAIWQTNVMAIQVDGIGTARSKIKIGGGAFSDTVLCSTCVASAGWYKLVIDVNSETKANFLVYNSSSSLIGSAYNVTIHGSDINGVTLSGDSVLNAFFDDATYTSDSRAISTNYAWTLNKDTNKLLFTDNILLTQVSTSNTDWFVNGARVADTNDMNLSATQLTDYNVCLNAKANSQGVYLIDYNSPTLTTGHNGLQNSAWDFNGTKIQHLSTSSNYAIFGKGQQTVSIWFKTNGSQGYIFAYPATSGNNRVYINLSGGSLNAMVGTGNLLLKSAGTFDTTQWHNVTLIRNADANKATFYFDKIKVIDNNSVSIGNTSQITTINMGAIGTTGNSPYTGLIDDVAIYDTNLSEADINSLYDNGILYNADLNVAWEFGDGKLYAATDTTNTYQNQLCTTINSGDWTPPTTTVTTSQVPGQSIQQVRFTCIDANVGCKLTTYRVNGGAWSIIANTSTADVNILGGGIKTLEYYSTDNASSQTSNTDNNEATKTTTLTTYGTAYFTFRNESTSTEITGITVDFNGTSTDTTGATYDVNLQGLTIGTYIFAFSHADYSTRYYQVDLNQYSDINKTIALISNSNDADLLFKVYTTNETTLFASTYVEILDKDTNFTLGRLKTDSAGEVTFNLKADDQNYWALVNNGQYIYAPVALLILFPKDEETTLAIDGNWRIDITQNLYVSYTELDANKIVYLLPNTGLPFNIKISDMNGDYFSRTYAKQYPGNPLTDTLQPYLVTYIAGLGTTIKSISGYTNQPVSGIQIKIYKYISSLGRTYVEEVLTDSKGEAITLLITGDSYDFEIYYNGVYVRTDKITATSSTIYVPINDVPYTIPTLGNLNTSILFLPGYAALSNMDKKLVQKIFINDSNSDVNIQRFYIKVLNTDINGIIGNNAYIYSTFITYAGSNSIINTIDINGLTKTLDSVPYDTNGFLKIEVTIQTGDGNFYAFFTYKPAVPRNPIDTIGFGSRNLFSCSSYYDEYGNPNPLIPCPIQLFIALLISFILTAGVAWQAQFQNPAGLGIVFMVIMGVFAYLTWIPIILYGLMFAGFVVVMIVARGRFN